MLPMKSTTPIEPIEISSLTHEESEDLEFRLAQIEKKVNKMDGSRLKMMDLSSSQEKN